MSGLKTYKKIQFEYSSLEEYEKHEEKLTERVSKAKLIEGTQQYHFYKPSDTKC